MNNLMTSMRISVNCPSYKRPKVETLDYLPFVRVWVDESEYKEYCSANPEHANQIVACPRGVQGNLCRVRNYILKTEFENGNDVVLIIDDDMKGVYYFETKDNYAYARHLVKAEDFLRFIEKYSILAKELGAYFWGININPDKQSYRHYNPFSTVSYIGGPFQCFLKGNECWYDERLPLKEDYDMTIQQLNRYRVALRVNKFFYQVKQAQQSGGCATYRNFIREQQQLEMLRKKWGDDIIKYDKNRRNHVTTKTQRKIDFNPIMKVPIKGV